LATSRATRSLFSLSFLSEPIIVRPSYTNTRGPRNNARDCPHRGHGAANTISKSLNHVNKIGGNYVGKDPAMARIVVL
jgi:hypothetical protein